MSQRCERQVLAPADTQWRFGADRIARHSQPGGWALLIAMVLTVGCLGCGEKNSTNSPSNETATKAAARSEVERGPAKLIVEVSPGKVRLSDEPQLTLTIEAQQGVRIEKPPFGAALGEFVIRDFYEPLPESRGDANIIRQVYTLEPTRAGTITVAPLAVTFHDERPNGDGKQHTIESESLTVEVSSVVADEAPSLANLRPASGPVELPAGGVGLGWWLLASVVAVGLLAAIVRKIRRRRSEDDEPSLSPEELAWLELEQLVENKLAETDVKVFYVELTGVVRRYIERSTGVHAPEQTTEEFLREIAGNKTFERDEQQRLRDFLEAADLVKFAGYEPQPGDIEESFNRAKRFIGLDRGAAQEVAA